MEPGRSESYFMRSRTKNCLRNDSLIVRTVNSHGGDSVQKSWFDRTKIKAGIIDL